MGKVSVFLHLTLDGFYAGPNGEIDWFKAIREDPEYDAYTHGQSEAGNTLIFGRTTYEMMKSWWPTPAAIAADPKMAAVVNESPKIVFSRKLKAVEEAQNWKNITLCREIDPGHVRTLGTKGDLTILGSGSIVRQFADLQLIEEYALIVVPVVLGRGKALFEGVEKTEVELLESRSFRNGLVLLRYKPA